MYFEIGTTYIYYWCEEREVKVNTKAFSFTLISNGGVL